ncbi:MAG: CDP-diacylglycerol--glycerol-3-phosphate 3-phosphatidyltransferase [Nitrospinota bacterium]
MAEAEDFSPGKATRGEAVVQRIGAATAARGIAWSVPNQITLVRILMTPLFIAFLIYGMKTPALAVFCLSGITDGLDGFIARRYQQATPLGALLDPLADKLLLNASFWFLSNQGALPVWLTILVVTRDALIVSGAMFMKLFEGKPALPPSFLGKLTTCAQLATIFWALLFYFQDVHAPFLSVISAVAAAVTFLSGIQYLVSFMRRVGDSS